MSQISSDSKSNYEGKVALLLKTDLTQGLAGFLQEIQSTSCAYYTCLLADHNYVLEFNIKVLIFVLFSKMSCSLLILAIIIAYVKNIL